MWSVIFALAIGAVYASLLYLFSKKYNKPLTILLFTFRTIVVTMLVMLFVNPYIKHKTSKIEPPIIVFAQDNSESIVLTKDSVFYKEKYPKLIDSVVDLLDMNYEISFNSFGASVISSEAERNREMTFSEQFTNISSALNDIARQYYKRNVGAVVLLSDGIVNQGVNPELNIENYPFPIYAVTLGDTVSYPSIGIHEVKYNKTVPANMLFPLRVTVNANNYKGSDIVVSVKMDGVEVIDANVSVTSNRFSKTLDFNIDSGDEGVKNIAIFLTPVETHGRASQQSTSSRRVFITVTDKKYRILCLAHAPHPDIAAIKSALDDHFEFDVKYDDILRANDDFLRANNDLPLQDYDLVIMHNSYIRANDDLLLPTLFIVGNDFDAFNTSQDVVKIQRGAANASLDVRGRYNNGFGLFTVDSDIIYEIQSYPPLALPHLEMSFNGRHDDLLLMNIMDVETPNPLLAFSTDADGNKQAFLFGTGCWRWKLYEYFHHKNNDGFNEIISKTVKYLLTEKDKELKINHKDSYITTEQIVLSAELRNPSMELVNEPDLQMTITKRDVSGNVSTYDYTFSKGENNYHLNIGMLSEGIYNYSAHTSYGGVDYNDNGTFLVEAIGVEAQDLTANIERMRSLASLTGGKHYYITDIQQLTNDLKNNEQITSISHEETRYDDMINLRWLFFAILGVITIEWVLRKMFGVY